MTGLDDDRGAVDPAELDLAALYARHRETMIRVAYDRLRSSGRVDETQDVVQDVVLAIMRTPPKEDVRNWEAFLVRAVINKVRDRLKSAVVSHDGGPLENQPEPPDESNVEDDVIEAVSAAQMGAVAWDCLAVLEANERKAVWENVALERSREELARDLSVTPGRISQLKKQGLEKLRVEMQRREAADD